MILVFDTMKKLTTIPLLALLLLTGCKSTRSISGGEVDSRLSVRRIIDNHYANQLDFTTIRGRVKVDYENGKASQGFTVNIRMQKDSVIWLSSSPIAFVKAMITPSKVSFYNKLQNEYFDGDFSYLSDLLGTELDFEKVQNLLLGSAVLDLRDEKYTSTINAGNYQLKPKKARELFKILFQLEPGNFKIHSQEISQPEENRWLTAKYTYQDISGKVLPNEIQIVALEKDENTTIDLNFRNLELNRPLNFPYKIPKGFDEIILK
ncbi:DUF4292 domain-containing protein [Flagellimonas myxillae]|uniref:DUF4292 domain-containing protein n=1 Tax=Flagellimonas myxillae TaxID=2942214 RepID=UPI00201ED552|nr:DUF4292 domain-containing protein [Muricauda myxillae]MCL6266720.1 DUF4292 domain-containing protein [Muricauda myxillae]